MSLSYSDINTFLRCGKQYEYRSIRKLQRKRTDAVLRQGTAIHALLMNGFLALQREDDIMFGVEEQYGELLEEVMVTMPFVDEREVALDMVADSFNIVQRYFDQADWEGWTVLHVEEEFSITIDGEEITFTPDLVLRDPQGNVWIVDHKSTDTIDPAGVPFSSQQSLLYLAGVRAHYPETVGFLFNYLRKKLPTEPRLNKTKTDGIYQVNDLNRIDTTYEMLLDFLRTEAPELLDHPRHRERLAELRDQTDRWFATRRVLTNEAALEQMVEETSWAVEAIHRAEETEQFIRVLRDDRGYTSCSRCEFNELCAAELLDFNTEFVLREYEPREPKNEYESDDDGSE